MKAKKSLGQNFLIDTNVISKIVTEVLACNDDLIIEIGPGQGALTKELKKYNANLMCYEVDRDLSNILSKLENNKTKVIWQDFLKSNIKEDIKNIKYNKLFIVGNLPYYITTPIIEHIMDSNINLDKLVIMVQREVAGRFLALPHTKEYGYITVILNYYFDIESGYRSYEYQEKIYNEIVREKGFNYALRSVAKPGYSEHQTGLAIDICIYKDGKSYIEHDIEDYPETKWLHTNAHKYGFILRYPKDKEEITGYMYEPWHLRYVGDISLYIYNNNLALEEYYNEKTILSENNKV